MNRLKHFGILLLTLILCSTSAQAAEPFRPQLLIGTSHGVSMASVTLLPKVKQDLLYGYNGGLFLRYISEKYFGLQIEMNYSMRGWKEAMENTPQYAYQRTMNYLELPILTHIYFGNKVRGFINLGPKLGLFLNESESINFDPDKASGLNVKYQYFKPTQKRFDYGICGGAGIEFATSIGHFGLEGRYYYGLADFFKTGSTSDFNTASMQTITVNLTYALPFSRKR